MRTGFAHLFMWVPPTSSMEPYEVVLLVYLLVAGGLFSLVFFYGRGEENA